ncbi:MAG TPA: PilN domain-containing protein [Nitrospiria bacterium]|nr:PilN domain-containing protein [Nitrospiria bacterium]
MKSYINLIAPEILFEEKPFSFKQRAIPVSVATGAVVLVVFSLGYWWKVSTMKKEVQELTIQRDKTQQELARLNGEIASLSAGAQAGQGVAAEQLAAMRDLLKNRILWSDVVREVSLLVPDDVWLTRLESTDSKSGGFMPPSTEAGLHFAGMAQSQAAINRFIAALEHSPRYGYVSLIYAQKEPGEGAQGMSFELTASLH